MCITKRKLCNCWGSIFVVFVGAFFVMVASARPSFARRYQTKNVLTLAQNEAVEPVDQLGSSDEFIEPGVSAAEVAVPDDSALESEKEEAVTDFQEDSSAEPEVVSELETAAKEQTDTKIDEPGIGAKPSEESPADQAVVEPRDVSVEEAPDDLLVEEIAHEKIDGEAVVPEEAPSVVERDPAERVGIDTVDIDEPEGNWLYKRMYWEQAEYRYEKLKVLLEKIMDLRMTFFDRHVKADKQLFDPFYLAVGIKEGKIDQVVSSLISYVDKKREEKGFLGDLERDFLATLEQERATLEKLRLDVQGIQKLHAAVDNALMILLNVIDQARGFEKQAWENFKAIARELSDKKAHALYYGIDNYWQNTKELHVYASTQLDSYFQQLVDKAAEQINHVRGSMGMLKERGIDLKERAEVIERELAAAGRSDLNVQDEESTDIVEKPTVRAPGLFAQLTAKVSFLFGSVWNFGMRTAKTAWRFGANFTSGLFARKQPLGDAAQQVDIPEPPAFSEFAEKAELEGEQLAPTDADLPEVETASFPVGD